MSAYVYLIHMDEPISHAQHYLGCTAHLPSRLASHANGRGSRLLEVALERGIEWRVARLWHGDFCQEAVAKRQHNGHSFCPICHRRAREWHGAIEFELELAGIPLTSMEYR